MRLIQKQIERGYVNKFLDASNLLEQVSCFHEANDPPDIGIQLNSKVVSIEVTQLINPILKEQESRYKKVIHRARELYSMSNRVKVRAYFTFKPKEFELYYLKNENKIHHEIAQAVDILVSSTESRSFRLKSKSPKTLNYLKSISIHSDEFDHWQHMDAWKVPKIDTSFVENRINKKEMDLSRYMDQYDESWLLLVHHIGSKSSSYDILDFSLSRRQSNFDKIVMFGYMSKEVTWIKT